MLITNKYVWIGGAVAAVAALLLARRAAGALGDAAEAVNPFNNDNVINRGVTSVYQNVTGSDGTIGTDIYDATHGGAVDITSDNNIINRGVSGIGSAVTGNKDWSLGTAIYDWTH
jgi:hypothetical protein